MGRAVALLRGINVGGNRKVPMADLRAVAEELGLGHPRTYVASGNLVFESGDPPSALEERLERALHARFGFDVDVVARSAHDWASYAESNPFPEESRRAPNLVMLVIGKRPPDEEALEALRARASAQEKVERRDDALWIWFGNGAGRSKIGTGPSRGVWTSRNWRTVQKLEEMLCSPCP
jgi:uncharacterized protein (DUF1697 family)